MSLSVRSKIKYLHSAKAELDVININIVRRNDGYVFSCWWSVTILTIFMTPRLSHIWWRWAWSEYGTKFNLPFWNFNSELDILPICLFGNRWRMRLGMNVGWTFYTLFICGMSVKEKYRSAVRYMEDSSKYDLSAKFMPTVWSQPPAPHASLQPCTVRPEGWENTMAKGGMW